MLRAKAWGSPSKLGYVLVKSQFIKEATHPGSPFEAHGENVSRGYAWRPDYPYPGISSKQQQRGSGEFSKGRNEDGHRRSSKMQNAPFDSCLHPIASPG